MILLFDGLAYNTSGHFAHCSYFLYAKPTNKVYLFNEEMTKERKRETKYFNEFNKEAKT